MSNTIGSVSRRTLLALAGGALGAILALPAAPAAARSAKPKHILIVTHTEGFHHDSIPTAEEVLQQIGHQEGWQTELVNTADGVRGAITPEHLKGVDLVIFANTTGELPISDDGKKAFMDWLRAGHGFVGMHAATDTLYQWPDYGKMIGGYFDGHPWVQDVRLNVEDPRFPGARAFAEDPVINDEIYQFRNWTRDDKHVIMSIDDASIDTSKGKRADKDYAAAWARREGKGRVFYTSLGHRQEVWRDPRYQALILGGIRWALGLAKADVKPGVKPIAKPGQ